MTTKPLTALQRALLENILLERRRVEALSPYSIHYLGRRDAWAQSQRDRGNLPFIRVNPQWSGSGAAARQARKRALQALQAAGLLVVDAVPGGHVFAELTPAGNAVAESLVSNAVDAPGNASAEKRDSQDVQPADAVVGASSEGGTL